jgi:hypothetical protein
MTMPSNTLRASARMRKTIGIPSCSMYSEGGVASGVPRPKYHQKKTRPQPSLIKGAQGSSDHAPRFRRFYHAALALDTGARSNISLALPPIHKRAAPPGNSRARSAGVRGSVCAVLFAEPVPGLVEQLEAMDDDQLLDILALIGDADGAYRFAESRVAKFIPGRVEDRLTQVREVRHTEKPAPPGACFKFVIMSASA